MLRSLELKFFRQHEDLKIDFTRGLNALRGPNESGKSSVLEAALYALYGTKALRDTLAETVTWGHKESELKVVLTICVNGIDYTFVRSKSGAEVYCGLGLPSTAAKVTGQAEVSAFAAELLGADVKTAGALMLASQNGLRGALADGPTAVSGLMSKLADFDTIDRIVTAAQDQLLLGSDQPFKAKLAAAEADVVLAQAAQIDDNAWQGIEQVRANLVEQAAAIEQHRAEVLEPAMDAAEQVLLDARQTNEERERLKERLHLRGIELNNFSHSINHCQSIIARRPDADAIDYLKAKLNTLHTLDGRMKAYEAFKRLPAHPETFWEGSREEFDAELERVIGERDAAKHGIATIDGEIAALGRQIITSGKCPTCGHAAMTDEHVAAKNAEIKAAISAQQHQRETLTKALAEHQESAFTLQNLDKAAERVIQGASKILNHVEMVEGTVPPVFQWKGEVPTPVNVTDTKRELDALEAAERAALQAEGRLAAETRQREALERETAATEALLARLPAVDVAPLEAAYRATSDAHFDAQARISVLHDQIAQCERNIEQVKRDQAAARERYAAAQRRVAECEDDLRKLAFNNNLVAKLRKLKPAVTDHLWSTVLAAVSNFFSGIRGETSVVTKETSGFKVNGRSVDSLSGSTLDALALSIRVALTKTFIPHATFMVLDEPAAACDLDRTGSMLGFLAAAGFEQTILASHDELSESVAENVIALGA